jgi:hypothetical protein
MSDEIRRSPAEAARIAARLELLRQIDVLQSDRNALQVRAEKAEAERDALRAQLDAIEYSEAVQWYGHPQPDNSPPPVKPEQQPKEEP